MQKIAYLILIFFLFGCAHKERNFNLCPKISIHSPDKIDFSDTEKRLVCGDPEEEAYKHIPAYQAKFSMQGFLQSKGYSSPDIKQMGDSLEVYTGEQTRLNSVEVNSDIVADSEKLQKNMYRHHRKEVLTPKLLDDLEREAVRFMRDRGYPCVKVKSKVNVDEGILSMDVVNLKSFPYGDIPRESIEGVDDRALARFYPFKPEFPFSQRGLDLTEKRFTRAGVVQGTFFQEKCELEKDSFSMTQEFIVGPPRTIRFGAGASTELGPIARAKWSNQRFGPMASTMEASLQASLKTQTLKLSTDQYWWPDHPRQSVLAELALERNDQKDFLEKSVSLKPHMQWSDDTLNRNWIWSSGPSFYIGSFNSKALDETRKYRTVAIEGTIQTQTHVYEIFDDHPQDGDYSRFNFDLRHPALGFMDPLFKIDYTFLKLLYIGHLGKGSAIGGLRINSGTTIVRNQVDPSTLPPSVKYYGGGSDDVRGFELATLPSNAGAGSLTKFSVKLEARKTHMFDPNLEGFTFVDTAWFGRESMKLQNQLWYSPGGGVRWFSPIGMVQTYLARALSNQTPRDDGFFFFVGIGGVF